MSTPTPNSTQAATTFADFQGQNYEKIKAECLKDNKLFVDDKFPATNASLFKFDENYGKNVTWKRPIDILKEKAVYKPEFIKGSITPADINQGDLGNQ